MKTLNRRLALAVCAPLVASAFVAGGEPRDKSAKSESEGATGKVQGNYAEVHGLKMYYEVHGTGQPIVLLHGSFGTNEGWATVLPMLAKGRQVIAIELQGHGHTNDLDRPLTYEQMADDTAALLKQMKVEQADFFGYSMGGTVALGVAIRHPELVRKLAIVGSNSGRPEDAFNPDTYKQYQSLPDNFAPPVLKAPYDKVAPDPARWPVLVTKIKELGRNFKGFTAAQVKSIKAQVLIMQGDRDGVRPEHAVEMYRLIANAQLAIFPGGDHFMLFQSPDKVLAALLPFLDAPVPEGIRVNESAAATPSRRIEPSQNETNNDLKREKIVKKVASKDGTSIAFERSGSGPVLILVAGALSDRSGSARLAALLAPHFTVINYDRRGRGASGDTQPYAVAREIEDIEALIDEAGGSAYLFGSSSGAVLALEATNRLRAKVKKAVLFEPPFIVDDSRPPVPGSFGERAAELVAAGRRGDAVEYFMTVAVGVPSEFVAQMKQAPMWPAMEKLAHTLAYDGAVLGETLSGKPLPAGRWAAAIAPTLVMDGGTSETWIRNAAQALSDILPHTQRRTLEGQDHSAPFTAPAAFVPVLVEFFAGP